MQPHQPIEHDIGTGHHLTYRNIFAEKMTDLMFLCRRCHTELHDTMTSRKTTGHDALIEIRRRVQRRALLRRAA